MIPKYPKHFYEPERIEIAVDQIRHDLRKILPAVPEKLWSEIDMNIAEWFSGEKFELEPVHDFWNFVSAFGRGLKFKSLLNWITAENIVWTKEETSVDEILITWDFPGLEFMGKAPYSAGQVRQQLNSREMKSAKENMIADSDYRSNRYVSRDQYRAILFYDEFGGVINSPPGYYILEGNRRVVRAIVKDQMVIPAYVGRFKNPADKWPENYWFNTGILRDLIFMAIYYDKEGDDKGFDFVRKFYQLLLRDFEVARIVTIDKAFKNFETSERLEKEILNEDLK